MANGKSGSVAFWEGFWKLYEKSLIVSGALALLLTLTICIIAIVGAVTTQTISVPSELWIAEFTCLTHFMTKGGSIASDKIRAKIAANGAQ